MEDSSDASGFEEFEESAVGKLSLEFPQQMFSLVGKMRTDEIVALDMITNNGAELTSVRVDLQKTKTHIQCHLQAAAFDMIQLLQQNDWKCRLDMVESDQNEGNPQQTASHNPQILDSRAFNNSIPAHAHNNLNSAVNKRVVIKKEQDDKSHCETAKSSSLLGVLANLADTKIKSEVSEMRKSEEIDSVEMDADYSHVNGTDDDEYEWTPNSKNKRKRSRKAPSKQKKGEKGSDDEDYEWKPSSKRKRKLSKRSIKSHSDQKKQQKGCSSKTVIGVGKPEDERDGCSNKNPICVGKPEHEPKGCSSKTRMNVVKPKRVRKETTKQVNKLGEKSVISPISYQVNDVRFQCVDCLKVKNDLDELVTHFKEEHRITRNFIMKLVMIDNNDYERTKDNPIGEVTCPYCYSERTKSTILKHISNCHDMMPDYDECISQMLTEASKAHGFLPLQLMQEQKCPECDVMFTEGKSMYKHFSTLHSDMKDYETKMITLEELIDVNLLKHSDIPYSECKFCKRDRQGASIFRHIYWCHPTNFNAIFEGMNRRRGLKCLAVKIGRNTCKYCLEVSDSYRKKLKHMQSCDQNPNHTGERLVCRFCCHTTPFVDKMEEHMKKHLEKYVCELCAQQFQYKSTFCLHKRKAHGIGKPIKTHKCPTCNKEFKGKSSYTRHIQTHQEKPHCTCEYCGKNFNLARSLIVHRNSIHLGIFPYYCDKCGYGLEKLSKLRKHRCERIRHRKRDIGGAAEVRAKFQAVGMPKAKPDIEAYNKKVTGWHKKRVHGAQEKGMSSQYYPCNMEEFHSQLLEKESHKEQDAIDRAHTGPEEATELTADVTATSSMSLPNYAGSKPKSSAPDKTKVTEINLGVSTPSHDSHDESKCQDNGYEGSNYYMDYPVGATSNTLQIGHHPVAHHHLRGWNIPGSTNLSGVAQHTENVTNVHSQQTIGNMPINVHMQPFPDMEAQRLNRPNATSNLTYGFGHHQ